MRIDDVATWLMAPPIAVAGDALPDLWRRSVLEVRMTPPPGFIVGPWSTGVVRGALGRALERRRDTDAAAALAHEFLFVRDLRITPGRSVPVPLLLAIEPAGCDVVLTATLVGLADAFRRSVFDALIEAIETGLSVGSGTARRLRPGRVTSADWTRRERIDVPLPTGPIRLVFDTPVRLGPRRALSSRWDDLVVGLADRIGRLARWQGLRVDMDLSAWRRRADSLRYDDHAMYPVAWDRPTSRNGGARVPMAGLRGVLDIENPMEPLHALLALGETSHAGAHTALGLGRYRLIC